MSRNPGDPPVDPWSRPGKPVAVLPALLERIGGHSPELVLLIGQYLRSHGEALHDRVTYTGGDPSIRVVFFLVEALLNYERLRIELLEQNEIHQQEERMVPGNQMLALSEILAFEPALLQVLSIAFDVHLKLWNAESGDYLEPKTEVRQERSDQGDRSPNGAKDRGRWSTDRSGEPTEADRSENQD